MKLSSPCVCLFASAIITAATIGSAAASPRLACSVLPLAEIESIVGNSLSVGRAGSARPERDSTHSACGYNPKERVGRGLLFTLITASGPKLAESQSQARADPMHTFGATAIKGGMFVSARVIDMKGFTTDMATSEKVLAAALRHL